MPTDLTFLRSITLNWATTRTSQRRILGDRTLAGATGAGRQPDKRDQPRLFGGRDRSRTMRRCGNAGEAGDFPRVSTGLTVKRVQEPYIHRRYSLERGGFAYAMDEGDQSLPTTIISPVGQNVT